MCLHRKQQCDCSTCRHTQAGLDLASSNKDSNEAAAGHAFYTLCTCQAAPAAVVLLLLLFALGRSKRAGPVYTCYSHASDCSADTLRLTDLVHVQGDLSL